MKISYNWLKQYINIENDPEELAGILTGIGLEVEGMEEWQSVDGGLEGVVIGKVVECAAHPNADTLSVTRVDTGSGELLSIVCGAPNVAAGQKVAVATIGTTLSIGGNEIVIRKSKIRGEISEGMICAEDELGMGDDHKGIIVLPPDATVGMAASEYFRVEKDVVFEIGLTPNRIDCGSHFGVARDLAAYFNQYGEKKAMKPSVDGFSVDNNNLHIPVIIENSVDCPRYTGLTISNITVKESPDWLKNRLRAIGLNPINNIVDITNYVLHEIGQPLHAFDTDHISGSKVIVKNLKEKTKFTTLDEQVRELSARDLMICNTAEGMCIGGVFGGLISGVTEKTRNLFLESAYFNPVAIRKTARRHDLHTDASFRFERGADPNITTWALKRAALLIREIAGGEISSEIVDNYPSPISNHRVSASFSNINRLTGKDIGEEKIRTILGSLDIIILSEENGVMDLEVPAYRVDVTREADVIEEILRIYGYNNIEIDDKVNSTLTYTPSPDKEKVVNTISDMLSGAGFNEIMSNSLNPSSWYDESPDFDSRSIVSITNPLSSDLNVMRQTLLFGGLSALARNINRQMADLRMFEFGKCYFRKDIPSGKPAVDGYEEKVSLDIFMTGSKRAAGWNHREEPTDLWYAKSILEMVFTRFGFDTQRLMTGDPGRDYFAEGMAYFDNKRLVAETGKIGRKYLSLFDIKQDVYYIHIEWEMLLGMLGRQKVRYSELPKYPSVRRDLALLVDKGIRFEQIRDLAFRTEKEILTEVGLFDLYENESLGNNKKSYAVSFTLRDDRKTLTDKMIDKVMNNFIRVFKAELDARIR